jgi:hypothetical protein
VSVPRGVVCANGGFAGVCACAKTPTMIKDNAHRRTSAMRLHVVTNNLHKLFDQ